MKYVKLFEEFINAHTLDSWAVPGAHVGSIGHKIVNHSYGEYRDPAQSMTKLSIGDHVICKDPDSSSFGKTGVVVAFEDATVRWKVDGTETNVGIDGLEYRCHPEHLQKIDAHSIHHSMNKEDAVHYDGGANQTDIATQ